MSDSLSRSVWSGTIVVGAIRLSAKIISRHQRPPELTSVCHQCGDVPRSKGGSTTVCPNCGPIDRGAMKKAYRMPDRRLIAIEPPAGPEKRDTAELVAVISAATAAKTLLPEGTVGIVAPGGDEDSALYVAMREALSNDVTVVQLVSHGGYQLYALRKDGRNIVCQRVCHMNEIREVEITLPRIAASPEVVASIRREMRPLRADSHWTPPANPAIEALQTAIDVAVAKAPKFTTDAAREGMARLKAPKKRKEKTA